MPALQGRLPRVGPGAKRRDRIYGNKKTGEVD
jgi:hypothetical protein